MPHQGLTNPAPAEIGVRFDGLEASGCPVGKDTEIANQSVVEKSPEPRPAFRLRLPPVPLHLRGFERGILLEVIDRFPLFDLRLGRRRPFLFT